MDLKKILLSILIALFILIAASVLIVSTTTKNEITTPPVEISPLPPEDGVACTLEAKLCPDGSYVGRTGPNCEFSPCPGE